MAVNKVNASSCLTSPTIILSGLIRREFLVKISKVISPFPSKLGGLPSNRTQCFKGNDNSEVSSIVITLSVSGTNEHSIFKLVVFPEPVPPEIKILAGLICIPSNASHKNAADSAFSVLNFIKSIIEYGSFLNFRIVKVLPLTAAGLMAAVEYLKEIGMENVAAHGRELAKYSLERLSAIPAVTIVGSINIENRGPVISFTIDGMHPHDVSEMLDQENIAVRGGFHCAMPLFSKLGLDGSVRASFYFYNSKEDVDTLVEGVKKIEDDKLNVHDDGSNPSSAKATEGKPWTTEDIVNKLVNCCEE